MLLNDPVKREKVGIIGQWSGGVLVGISLGYEVATGADLGLIGITLGSLLYAAFTKLRKI